MNNRPTQEKTLTDPAPSSPTDFSGMLEGIRAAIAAEGSRKGLAGKVQAAILGFLETLLALLADFRAGRLAAPESYVSAPAEAGERVDADREGNEVTRDACDAGRVSLVQRWILAPAQAGGRLFAGMMGFGGEADHGADPASLCAPGSVDFSTEENAEERRGGEPASASGGIPIVERWIAAPVRAGDRGADPASLCALRGEDFSAAENAEERRGAELASASSARGPGFVA